jgi:hypothetical protein
MLESVEGGWKEDLILNFESVQDCIFNKIEITDL